MRVTGIDISAAMLKIARERVARKGLRQVKGLLVMDAGALEFPDAQFDVALAPYVMSVVPHPERVLSETWRVVRPGGQMIVMNHFAARGGPRAYDRSCDGEVLRLARLASEVPLFRGRRLDRRSRPTRSCWSGANSRRCGCSRC